MSIEPVTRLQQLIEDASHIAVLTGAGMSTESGIPDFRSGNGVWQDSDLLRTMSAGYLRQYPEQFWPKYKQVFMREEYLRAVPNQGHLALARLELQGKNVAVFTQNVDGLHQAAGSTQVYELHGSIRYAECPACRHDYGLDYLMSASVPRCNWMNQKDAVCGHVLRPDTVLFGQSVRHLEHAVYAMQNCDLLLVLGTSLTVDPVADLPNYARRAGVPVAVVNLDETYFDAYAQVIIGDRIGRVLGTIVDMDSA